MVFLDWWLLEDELSEMGGLELGIGVVEEKPKGEVWGSGDKKRKDNTG